ncbi:hypothetical protein EMIT0P228_10734 [Pseudomonas brassicacearum]
MAAEAPRNRSPIIHQIVDRAFANKLAVAIIVQAKKGRNLPANKPLLLLWFIRGRLGVKEAGQYPKRFELLNSVAAVGADPGGANGLRQSLFPPL